VTALAPELQNCGREPPFTASRARQASVSEYGTTERCASSRPLWCPP